MKWFYLFTKNAGFPDPLEEIGELAAVQEEGVPIYLKLAGRDAPPMKAAVSGETVYLCTRTDGRWEVWGEAKLEGQPVRCQTPESVSDLYGVVQGDRWWRQLSDISLYEAVKSEADVGLPDGYLPKRGQASVISYPCAPVLQRLAKRPPSPSAAGSAPVPIATSATVPPALSCTVGQRFVGIDLTAGIWQTALDSGKKPFYIVSLVVDDHHQLRLEGVASAMTLAELKQNCWVKEATGIAIDGPCAANGITLNDNRSDFSYLAPGFRESERALAAMGIKLFWTTERTCRRFRGAREWIARSLALFADLAALGYEDRVFEVHPHATFSLLQRYFLPGHVLPSKTTDDGREQRISLLRLFVPDITPADLPDHDAVDSASAALMGALREAGHAIPLGRHGTGGRIWIPTFNVTPAADSPSNRASETVP